MPGPFNFDEDETNRLPDDVPVHTHCGLPVELCVCPDARVKFIDGRFVDTAGAEPQEEEDL